jgi:hypothetical protein
MLFMVSEVATSIVVFVDREHPLVSSMLTPTLPLKQPISSSPPPVFVILHHPLVLCGNDSAAHKIGLSQKHLDHEM